MKKNYKFRQFDLTVEPVKSDVFPTHLNNAKAYYASKKSLQEMSRLYPKIYNKTNSYQQRIKDAVSEAIHWGRTNVKIAQPAPPKLYAKMTFTLNGRTETFEFTASTLRQLYEMSREKRRSFVQSIREKRREMYIETRTIPGRRNRSWTIQSIGNCFTEPNGILKLQEQRSVLSVLDEKTPRNNDRYVGIEIEFCSESGQNNLAKKMDAEGLGKWVHLKGDGSVEPDDEEHVGHEATVLAKESEFEEVIQKLVKVIQSDGGYVNKTCGMHVHLDMRSRNRDLAFSNLVSAQTILYAMNPKSRKTSTYCQRTDTKSFQDAERQGDRYRGVNACSFSRHKTLEVRIHSGTIEARKICNWVKILIKVADQTSEVSASPRKVETFAEKYGITDSSLLDYMKERIAKFRDNGVEIEEAA